MKPNGCEKEDCEFLLNGTYCKSPVDKVNSKDGYPICQYHKNAIPREKYNESKSQNKTEEKKYKWGERFDAC